MSTHPFLAGDKVVCINDDWDPAHPAVPLIQPGPPRKDIVYCVRGAFVATDGTGPSVRLVGITAPLHPYGIEYGWAASCFRRVWTQTVTTTNHQQADL